MRIYSTFDSLKKRLKDYCVKGIGGGYFIEPEHIYILQLKST